MNYVLQIVRGRSEASTLRLIDGINSIGRHDDCQIRIRSAQVSRRHCEVFEDGQRLMLRDLGSSNGTYVNGKRVLGQQSLKAGDVLTIGGVTLRVDPLKAPLKPDSQPALPPKANDTAELDALPVAEEDMELEDFDIALEDEPAPEHIDIIPFDDEPEPTPAKKDSKQTAPTPTPSSDAGKSKRPGENKDADEPTPPPASPPEEEDAVAQFLMDLKLDEDD